MKVIVEGVVKYLIRGPAGETCALLDTEAPIIEAEFGEPPDWSGLKWRDALEARRAWYAAQLAKNGPVPAEMHLVEVLQRGVWAPVALFCLEDDAKMFQAPMEADYEDIRVRPVVATF